LNGRYETIKVRRVTAQVYR